jgi:predicted neuraminidase
MKQATTFILLAFMVVRSFAVVPKEILDETLAPVWIDQSPGTEYRSDVQSYAMVIGLERTPRGRYWAAWVGGGDDENALFVVASSDDDGATWSRPRLVIDPADRTDGLKMRTLVGNLWTDPLGRLWLFYDQAWTYFDGRAGNWAIVCKDPDADHPQWSTPQRIWHGCTLNKPTVLANGDWLLPISLWTRDHILDPRFSNAHLDLDDLRMAHVFASCDQGKTWRRRGGIAVPERRFDEHMFVELKDGRIWTLIRTNYGLAESFSSDQGRTWTEPQPSKIKHVRRGARIFLRRLTSGNLLLVKHGWIDEALTARSHLRAFISSDEGKTWRGGLLLDGRTGVSYPDGIQDEQGRIAIIYDRERARQREILLARFTEADVLAKRFDSPGAFTQRIINKATGPAKEQK